MKRKLLPVLLFLLCSLFTIHAENNPVASPEAIVKSGSMRFTVLTPQMIRIECSSTQSFDDKASFTIVNRNLPVPHFTSTEENGYLIITTDALTLKYKIGTEPMTSPASSANLNITMNMNGRNVVWYPGKEDVWNLKGTCRTLDGSNGDNKRSEMENGVISRTGWSVIDDSYATKRIDGGLNMKLEPNDCGFNWLADPLDKTATDWYFMGYGRDYKKALYDYTLVAGKIPLPPSYVFGYWYSKYQKYSSQDFMDLINDIEANDIPIDVMVIDTDWHINGWTGWSWNKDLIPDPSGLLSWLHNHHVKVPLNLHPAYGVDNNEDNFMKMCKDLSLSPTTSNIPWNFWDVNFYKSLFKNIISLRESEGVDFWWLDWQQWLTDENYKGLSETFWCNHVFYEDMRVNRPERRPVIFHRWAGLGSHRYQIGFSGDCYANFPTLTFQPYFTATAANVGYGYWGHDLGGHVQIGDNNPELYLRWLQFGVFSPIFRTHSTNSDNIERRIWKYPNFALMLDAVNLRYSLFPYIYSNARNTYDTGISMCRPLYYDSPEANEAYNNEGEYMFGDYILVAPITEAAGADGISTKTVWLPEGEWFDVSGNKMLSGGKSYTLSFTQGQIPYFIKQGAIIPTYPAQKSVEERPSNIIVKAVGGADGQFALYEDAGNDQEYLNGAYTSTLISQSSNDGNSEFTIAAREGSFNGMQISRSYTFEILASEKPKSVMINGVTADAETWSYDEEKAITYVNIPDTSCDTPISVSVEYSSSAVETPAKPEVNLFYHNNIIVADLGELKHEATLDIYDTIGNKVLSKTFTECGNITYDISSLSRSCYTCVLKTDSKTLVTKIIK